MTADQFLTFMDDNNIQLTFFSFDSLCLSLNGIVADHPDFDSVDVSIDLDPDVIGRASLYNARDFYNNGACFVLYKNNKLVREFVK